MIRSSACQRQADTFPALSGRHGERRSYTTSWDTILRGEEICYRLFDQGLSPMAVAHLMGLQLTSVRNRQRSWVKLGGKQRPAVDFETLPERKYYRRYND